MQRVLIFVIGVFVGAMLILFLEPGKKSEHASATAAPPTVAVPSDAAPAVMPRPAAPVPADLNPNSPVTPPAPTDTAVVETAPKVDPSVMLSNGKLLIPVAGLRGNQLTDTFTQSRGTGRVHEAIDIMAPKGTRVLAVADGKVVKLFNSKAGGLTLYQFDTGERLAYYYAHLDAYAPGIAEGKQLKRGDLVGYVGSTGNASPGAPHLHFAIFELGPEKQWWKGTAINPYPLLKD